MLVALLSDVHANLPALEAVLADARNENAEAIWNLGDFLGYGPHPREVVARLREAGAISIRGNYDRKVLSFPRKAAKWRDQKIPEKYEAFRWAHERAGPDALEFLQTLPGTRTVEVGPVRVALTHGSPADDSEAVSWQTDGTRLAELAALAEADLICCGHTHRAMDLGRGRVRFLNPGSVGRPEAGDWRAAYALVEFADKVWFRSRRIEYDLDRTLRDLQAAGLPEDFGRMLQTGRNLDQVRGADTDSERWPREAEILARKCNYEREHTHQVTKLALELFDKTSPLHGFGARERVWLHCGALLHDIGWMQGRKGHHKAALRRIMSARELTMPLRDRRAIATIARYHRKALPRPTHEVYADLAEDDRVRVRVLAGLLRVADGLDRTHSKVVQGVDCAFAEEAIVVRCDATGPAGEEMAAAGKKADLLQAALNRSLMFRAIMGV